MANEFHKVAIFGRHDDPRVAEAMAALVDYLTINSIEVLAVDDMTLDIPVTRVSDSELSAQADLMIAIGGDGTMLYAGRYARDSGTPLLGVNRGRLGFLADVTPDEMLASVEHILNGNYSLDPRLLLQAELVGSDGKVTLGTAFNDVVVQRCDTGRMVDLETRVGGTFVNTHSGDGLIVATPTGSTAYALSCGGPIIEPQMEAFVVVPICSHTLTDRPVVVSVGNPIEVRMLKRDGTSAEVVVDGQSLGPLLPESRLVISATKIKITLIHPPGYDSYEILRSKLFWGRDNRVRDDQTRSN
jgi:NAD+ kinase